MANDPYKTYRRRIEASLNRIERNTAPSEPQTDSPPAKQVPLLSIVATLLSLLAVIVTVSIYFLELSGARKNAAQSIYADYVALAVAHPEFANGLELPALSCNDDDQACLELKSRYDWYLSFALFAFEKVIIAFPNDHDGWIKLVKDQVCYHRTAIFGAEPLFKPNHYGTELQDFMQNLQCMDYCPAETSFPNMEIKNGSSASTEEISDPDANIIHPCPVHSTGFVNACCRPEG